MDEVNAKIALPNSTSIPRPPSAFSTTVRLFKRTTTDQHQVWVAAELLQELQPEGLRGGDHRGRGTTVP